MRWKGGGERGELEIVDWVQRDGRRDGGSRLTNANCTAPQKHVAVASSSLDQPSLAKLLWGM